MDFTAVINILIEALGKIMGLALTYALIIAVAYLKDFIADRLKMEATAQAFCELDDHIVSGVFAIQQTTVDDLKAAAEDGKLTTAEIEMLHTKLIAFVKPKLSDLAVKLITAAGIDIEKYILDRGEAIVAQAKKQ